MRATNPLLVLAVLGCSGGCGGGGATPDGRPSDGPSADAMSADAASPDATVDAAPDAMPDAMPPIAITSVAAAGTASTELRQDSAGTPVAIHGYGFTGATSVSIGDLSVYQVTITDTEIDALVDVVPAHAPGPVAVTVVAPLGTATAAGALTVTFVIVAPGGTAGARATYDDPGLLCDDNLQQVIGNLDTVEVQAGDHACMTSAFFADVNFVGKGSATTTVHAPIELSSTPGRATLTVSGLHLQRTGTALALDDGAFTGGDLVIDDAAIGIAISSPQPNTVAGVALDGLVFRGGGTAITTGDDGLTLAHATITRTTASSAPCLSFGDGAATVDHATITGCAIAIQAVGGGIDVMPLGSVTVTASQLVDNAVAIELDHPEYVQVTGTSIHDDESTPAPATTAISIPDTGQYWMTGGDITGYVTAIEGHGHGDHVPNVVLDGVTIDAEHRGVVIDSLSDPYDSYVTIHRTTIHAHGGDAVFIGYDTFGDLGTTAQPGANVFTSTGGYALDADVGDLGPGYDVIDAHGTTLNGTSYDGQTLVGPTTIGTDVNVTDGSTVRF